METNTRQKNKYNCSECLHFLQETIDDVTCCNCCENGSFFELYVDRYTFEDLGENWY